MDIKNAERELEELRERAEELKPDHQLMQLATLLAADQLIALRRDVRRLNERLTSTNRDG